MKSFLIGLFTVAALVGISAVVELLIVLLFGA